MKIRFFFLTVFLTICFSASAQTDEFQQEIVDYLSYNGTNDQYSIAYEEMFQVIKQQFASANVPESVWDELEADKKEDLDEVVRLLTFAYRKHFTREDISSMLLFYKTEAGQMMASGSSERTSEQNDQIEAFFASSVGKKISEKRTELVADISQISEYWSRDLFGKKMGELVKKGYSPQQ